MKKWFLLLVSIVVLVSSPLAAQNWSGGVGAAYLWQDVGGNGDAFRSQFNLQEGFYLEDLSLLYRGDDSGVSKFSFDAWGFGDANPSEAARLRLDLAAGFSFVLDYDNRSSFFSLGEGDFSERGDDWEIDRFRGAFIIDAWRPVRFSLIYREVETEGTVRRTMYGLNEQYPIGVNLDQSMEEITFRLETRTLPVRLELEQSFASYESSNRPFATGDEAIGGDPDDLDDYSSTVTSKMDDVPTTRFVASYSSRRFEGAFAILWRSSDLKVSGAQGPTFGIDGGNIGTIQVIDDVLSSADQDSLSSKLSLGFLIAPRWTLRLSGDYRDGSANSNLVGDRVIRIINSFGNQVDLETSWTDSGLFDYTDSLARLTVEYRGDTWGVWAGGGMSSRDAKWRLTDEQDAYDVSRDGSGYLVGGMWNPSRALDVTLEFDRGDFDDYVFRLDPETVDRATLKLRSHFGKGWQLQIHGRHVSSENPTDQAGVDWESTPYGAALSWTAEDGNSTVGLDLEKYAIETDTMVVLPGGVANRSIYDLDLTTATLFGNSRFGNFGVRGSLTYLEDSGTTWPLDSMTGRLRLTYYGSSGLEYSAIAQYWDYNEQSSDLDDFDVFRYGLAITWRFE